jgi:hypothetical protein
MNLNTTELEQFKNKITNPAVFGPGIWYNIHIHARDATSEDKKKKFKDFIENTISNLPCSTCQEHATTYYKSNPLSHFWTVKENGNEIGLLKWTWNFHNTVNNRLKKPYMSWEVAKMLYSPDSGVCTEVCGAEEQSQNTPQTTITPITPSSTSLHLPVTIKDQDLLQKYTPKNIIRPNSIEKSRANRFRNA